MQYAGKKPAQFKLILLGEPGVGKTTLFDRYRAIDEEHTATSSCHCSREFAVGPGSLPIEVALWDTANMERLHSLTDNYFREAEGAILVYDVADHLSLHAIPEWRRDCLNISPSVQLFLVGNKMDLSPQEFLAGGGKTTLEHADVMSAEVAEIEATYRVSARDGGAQVEAMFRDVAQRLWRNRHRSAQNGTLAYNTFRIDGGPSAKKRLCCRYL